MQHSVYLTYPVSRHHSDPLAGLPTPFRRRQVPGMLHIIVLLFTNIIPALPKECKPLLLKIHVFGYTFEKEASGIVLSSDCFDLSALLSAL